MTSLGNALRIIAAWSTLVAWLILAVIVIGLLAPHDPPGGPHGLGIVIAMCMPLGAYMAGRYAWLPSVFMLYGGLVAVFVAFLDIHPPDVTLMPVVVFWSLFAIAIMAGCRVVGKVGWDERCKTAARPREKTPEDSN